MTTDNKLPPSQRGLVERLTESLASFTKHYDPQWMEPPDWASKDDSDCSVFSRHTFGDLRKAVKLIEEARNILATETLPPSQISSGSDDMAKRVESIIGDYVDLADPRHAQMMRFVRAAIAASEGSHNG